jgi:hypothetical protein
MISNTTFDQKMKRINKLELRFWWESELTSHLIWSKHVVKATHHIDPAPVGHRIFGGETYQLTELARERALRLFSPAPHAPALDERSDGGHATLATRTVLTGTNKEKDSVLRLPLVSLFGSPHMVRGLEPSHQPKVTSLRVPMC